MSISEGELRGAVPDTSGSLTLSGLDGEVDVFRDELGIPHIRAGSLHDAFFAQGFVHAQDRLWQMDYDRKRAYGRWAEFAGKGGVEQDILMRRLGLGASAKDDYQAFDDETRAMVDAYTAGINAFIQTTPVLPAEYQLVDAQPEPWQPWDPCAAYKVRHVLMGVWHRKLWGVRQLKTIGEEMLQKLRIKGSAPDPLVVPPGVDYEQLTDGTDDLTLHAEGVAGIREWLDGSNNWTIHGSRTATGKPLLAGDPHRAIDVPNVYYQNHLSCPEFDVVGFSFCGVPGFPHFAHNQWVAWGITHAGADYQDLYVERFKPGDPTRYQFQGEWLEAEHREETIKVRGGEDVVIPVTITRHGPIIVGDPASGYALAGRYSATERPNTGFRSLLPMLKARSVAEFDESMRHWVDPCNNLVIADVDGNIGYLMRGKVPIRSKVNGFLPVPGWTGEHEWDGWIPFEELPRSRNPDTGFIVTANNRIVGDDYPYYVATDWSPGNRAERIITRLKDLPQASIEDMPSVHADKISIPSQVYVKRLDTLGELDGRSARAVELLRAWDGAMLPESAPAAIYAVWREMTLRNVLNDGPLNALATGSTSWMPTVLAAASLSTRLRPVLVELLDAGDESVLPDGKHWPDVLREALSAALDWLEERLGPDMQTWQWKAIHRTGPVHTLAASFPELASVLNPPTVGVGGDSDTPQAGGFGGIGAGDFKIMGASVNRYAFDLDDWERSGWVVPLGSSGHPGSKHFADQVEAWSEQRLYPMYYDWSIVEQHAETTQRLMPAG